LDEVKVCTSYKVVGVETSQMPFDVCDATIEPIYESFPGWQDDLTKMRKFDELPASFKSYCHEISKRSDCKINIISVGPDREETIPC
jgi:adenylosuccinate synthase